MKIPWKNPAGGVNWAYGPAASGFMRSDGKRPSITGSNIEVRMKAKDIAGLRLVSQQLIKTKLKTVKDIVGRLGAMQAQDYAMAKWAIGVRLPHSTNRTIETAINKGEIIRTHLLRPTWHFASAEDVRWMLELTAPQIRSSMIGRHREMGLTGHVLKKSYAVMEKALRGGVHLTRDELIAELGKAKIATDGGHASHLFLSAESEEIICSGGLKDGRQTYALLDEWVPKTKSVPKEEALAKLAARYFSGHGPASLQDFVWWSGLPVIDARKALESVKRDFLSETIDTQTYWFSGALSAATPAKDSVHLLPAFDEFIISYKDRRASLPLEKHHKAVSNNGIFRPIIAVNGRVTGIWKRTIKKDKDLVSTTFFERPDKTTRSLIEQASAQYIRFIENKPGRDSLTI
jgi:hypothetical protein